MGRRENGIKMGLILRRRNIESHRMEEVANSKEKDREESVDMFYIYITKRYTLGCHNILKPKYDHCVTPHIAPFQSARLPERCGFLSFDV